MNKHLFLGGAFLIAAAAIPYLGERAHLSTSWPMTSLLMLLGFAGLALIVWGFVKLMSRWSRIALGIYLAGVVLMLVATPAGLLYAKTDNDWMLIGRVTEAVLFWPLVVVTKLLHLPLFYH